MPELNKGNPGGSICTIPPDPQFIESQLENAALVARRLAHDYGNILTSIIGYCELALIQIPESNSASRLISSALQSAVQGAALTNRVRLFAHRPELNGITNNLRELLLEEWEEIQARHGAEAALDLHLEFAPGLVVHPDYLRLMIRDLLQNSVEAMGVGGKITVTADAMTIDANEASQWLGNPIPGAYWHLRIEDDGTGLSEAAQMGVFCAPFFTDKPYHRGYGLAVVYGIVKTHRGGIRISSSPSGTTVDLLLPTVTEPCEIPDSAPTLQPMPRQGMVLVVDDDPTILQMLTRIVRQSGRTVRTATNGEEALQMVQKWGGDKFAMVLSDWFMPKMSGPELAQALAKEHSSLPVVFMSGDITMASAKAMLSDMHVRLIPKPFSPHTLLAMMDLVCG